MKFIIVFQFLYYEDVSFRKMYFKKWNGNEPLFTERKNEANAYSNFGGAYEDLEKLEKAKSPVAKTLNIRIVRSD